MKKDSKLSLDMWREKNVENGFSILPPKELSDILNYKTNFIIELIKKQGSYDKQSDRIRSITYNAFLIVSIIYFLLMI